MPPRTAGFGNRDRQKVSIIIEYIVVLKRLLRFLGRLSWALCRLEAKQTSCDEDGLRPSIPKVYAGYGLWFKPQCRMPDYAACIVGTRFRRQFEGDLHRVVLIFRGIVRSFKGLAEMITTDRLA